MEHRDTKAGAPRQAAFNNAHEPHALVTDGFVEDLPPSYEASTATPAVSASAAPPSNPRSPTSNRSDSISSTRSHHGLLVSSSPPAPEPRPHAGVSSPGPHSSEAYRSQAPMACETRDWEELRGKPGCCASTSGGCCFSSRGGCCFSDRGGACCSDREGCCFSDRQGCCFSDRKGCCCGDNGAAGCSG